MLTTSIKIPDERSALVLKTMAWDVRRAGKDAVDVWRCLEIANAANLGPDDFASSDGKRALGILDRGFSGDHAEGTIQLVRTQNLAAGEANERATRVKALIARVRAPSS